MAAQLRSTGAPLRGLASFTEAERAVLYGRDQDLADVLKMVTADSYRAGLLYGEPGVGKSSFLWASVVPTLREKQYVVVPCADPAHPAQSFCDSLLAQSGLSQHQNEHPLAYASRVVANAPANKLHFFVVDDVDQALLAGGDRVVAELTDLFSRVIARGAGRARILFTAASETAHVLLQLERRTGSLFPPASRHELARLGPADAAQGLQSALSYGGVTADGELIDQVVSGLAKHGGVLPADLQIAALALRDLRIDRAPALHKLGGASELESGWIGAAAKATGHERTGLRLLGEIAEADGATVSATHLVQRLGLTAAETSRSLSSLEERGVIVRGSTGSEFSDDWMLSHPLLAPRIRELTAGARAAARRGYDLLGSKAQSRQRLSWREMRALRHEDIAPVNDAERAVVSRSKRFYLAILAGIAAVPIVILLLLWNANRGRYFYDLESTPGGERVLVRDGRAGLSSFHWMGFGEVIADPGLSRGMVDPKKWKEIGAQDLGGSSGWAEGLDKLLRPELAALLQYAASGDKAALATLDKLARDPDARADLLHALAPIARGTDDELLIVNDALHTATPALLKAGVGVARDAVARGIASYREVLIAALVGQDPELRRITLNAVRDLPPELGAELINGALARDPTPDARRELQAEVSTAAADDAPAADAAIAVLASPDSTAPVKNRAKEQLRRAVATDRVAGLAACATLLANDAAPTDVRVFAANLLEDTIDVKKDDLTAITEAARVGFAAKADPVRIASLPLYAKADPARAADDLTALMNGRQKAGMRAAMATAWGALAQNQNAAAAGALDKLLKDPDADVKAAAAAAMGYLGRVAQEPLLKLVKNGGFVVAVGAANGLAATAEVGASISEAINGIAQLWKDKGKPRREAAKIYARIARRKPGPVMNYLNAAARNEEDPELHPIGVEGLCNGANAGNAEARKNLAKLVGDPSTDVRRLLIRCVADGPDPGKNGVAIATKLVKDSDPTIKADAARILALATKSGKVSGAVADALVGLIEDPSRDIRLIAIRAVAALGKDGAPKAAPAALARAFERGDEGEKRALLQASRDLANGDLVAIAIADGSAQVRVDALDLAIATGTRVAASIASALADADAQVRRAALSRIAGDGGKLIDASAVDRALALGVHDQDPELSQLALNTLVKVGVKDGDATKKEAVKERLRRALDSRAESERARAAIAAAELETEDALALLEPMLKTEPSHDVRVALLRSLGAAYQAKYEADPLAALMRGAEKDAMKRLVVAAAFLILAETSEGGRDKAKASVETLATKGPPMARRTAKLALGLLESGADGLAFLEQLVP